MTLTAGALVNGLIIGCGFALVALGWTLLLGAGRIINFAHGQLFMLGGFITWFLVARWDVPYFVAGLVALVAVGLVGVVMQVSMMQMTLEHDLVKLMVATLGFSYLLTGGATLVFGGEPQRLRNGLTDTVADVGGAAVSIQDLLVVTLTIGLFVAMQLVLHRTGLGRRLRAVAEDPDLAELYGLSPALTYIGIFTISAALAAVGGLLLAPRGPIFTSGGTEQVIMSFVIVVLGGVGSVWGSLAAGVGVGVFISLFGTFVSPAYSTAALFLIVILVMVARPEGLSGSVD